MTTLRKVPPFDAELGATLGALGDLIAPTLTPDMIEGMRESFVVAPVDDLLSGRPVTHLSGPFRARWVLPTSQCLFSSELTTPLEGPVSITSMVAAWSWVTGFLERTP